MKENLKKFWANLQSSPAKIPLTAEIPEDHVNPEVSDEEIRSDEHYFIIRVNEMYLTKSRKWFNSIDPMVFFITEFNYNGEDIAVPYVIGPMLIEKYGKGIPEGMIFSNTPVAGLHPYKGGGLTLSVILYQNTRKNYARELLGVVENVSNAIGFSSSLSQYLKVGDVIFNGIQSLIGLGDTVPLIGYRKNFDPKAGDKFSPRYFVLVNTDNDQIDASQLWVKNNQLFTGEDQENLKPFRAADFVLYSIMATTERDDLNSISFFPQYQSMIKSAMDSTTELKWKATKAEMMNLAKEMRFHPDLSVEHYKKLRTKYENEMIETHKEAVMLNERAAGGAELDKEGKDIMEILDL